MLRELGPPGLGGLEGEGRETSLTQVPGRLVVPKEGIKWPGWGQAGGSLEEDSGFSTVECGRERWGVFQELRKAWPKMRSVGACVLLPGLEFQLDHLVAHALVQVFSLPVLQYPLL